MCRVSVPLILEKLTHFGKAWGRGSVFHRRLRSFHFSPGTVLMDHSIAFEHIEFQSQLIWTSSSATFVLLKFLIARLPGCLLNRCFRYGGLSRLSVADKRMNTRVCVVLDLVATRNLIIARNEIKIGSKKNLNYLCCNFFAGYFHRLSVQCYRFQLNVHTIFRKSEGRTIDLSTAWFFCCDWFDIAHRVRERPMFQISMSIGGEKSGIVYVLSAYVDEYYRKNNAQ